MKSLHQYLLPSFLVTVDIISIIFTGVLALLLRFEFLLPPTYLHQLVAQLPIFIAAVVGMALISRLYVRLWRHAGSSEIISIVGAVVAAMVIAFLYGKFLTKELPHSIYILWGILLMAAMGCSRFGLKIYGYLTAKARFYNMDQNRVKRTLVVGAGDAGAVITREIQQFHIKNRQVVGFIDDDLNKLHHSMYGIRILGTRDDIPKIVDDYEVDDIIIAIPSAKAADQKAIINICKKTKCTMQILPGVYEIINGKASMGQLRKIEIEDLLGRDPVQLDSESIRSYLENKVVLITGAGGSIGSEICRQVIKMNPKKILLLGKGENSIYEIHQELSEEYSNIAKVPVIADVRDAQRIEEIMAKYKPQVIFHAAAHKHVPLMEYQPIEAVKNNVLGTKNVAELAAKYQVETFVMVSTDKAVNPTSVMGCTKRVAEMYVQSMNGLSKTRFVAVRFGNVLGSRGSVIPLFKKQVAKGGPLTVTHPEMKRYFMTIPEASQLVLQAGGMAKGGEVFVLDMGEPIKIADLARNVIELSGYVPDEDVKIKYTGLRPGEKLFEELLSAEDGTDSTNHEKIFTARIKLVSKEQMDKYVELLISSDVDEDVVKHLQEVVPSYKPNRINK